uniref:Uncharacterized protein n=1 Tax=Rhizophora mucronata TaxID=61149 RepID=A0A2P2QWY0_RHIMU
MGNKRNVHVGCTRSKFGTCTLYIIQHTLLQPDGHHLFGRTDGVNSLCH